MYIPFLQGSATGVSPDMESCQQPSVAEEEVTALLLPGVRQTQGASLSPSVHRGAMVAPLGEEVKHRLPSLKHVHLDTLCDVPLVLVNLQNHCCYPLYYFCDLRVFSQVGKMAWWIEQLLCKQEDLSSTSTSHMKKRESQRWLCMLITPDLQKREVGAGTSVFSQPSQSGKCLAQ